MIKLYFQHTMGRISGSFYHFGIDISYHFYFGIGIIYCIIINLNSLKTKKVIGIFQV